MGNRFCRKTLAFAASVMLCGAAVYAEDGFLTDPESPELLALAQTLEVNEDDYGAGPLLEPGAIYYASPSGDDAADGLSWATAWRTVQRATSGLGPGDTLLFGEGVYRIEAREWRSFTLDVSGERGRPIRIMAAPRARVVFDYSQRVGPFTKTPGRRFVHQAPLEERIHPDVWEADSLVRLQNVDSVERADELPGTCYYDEEAGVLYVHFSDGRPGEGRYAASRIGMHIRVAGSYLLFRGIHFRHGQNALVITDNEHVTVEQCVFYANAHAGLSVTGGARRLLARDNYGFANETRGSIAYVGGESDCLYIRNHLDPSKPTIREGQSNFHFGINQYGTQAGSRIIILDNVMNDTHGFRWKPLTPRTVFQGNVSVGFVDVQSHAPPAGDDRLVVRNNVVLSRWVRRRDFAGPGGPGDDWAGPHSVFLNNFHVDRDAEAVESARFADPAWLDFRLQGDSPLREAGVGGADRGAHPGGGEGRVLYVGPDGDDAASGLSARQAFASLSHAASQLQAGDTLYVFAGRYGEPLNVAASGTEGQPVRIRPYGKARVVLPSLRLAGGHVIVERFEVDASSGDAVAVSGVNASLRHCVVRGAPGAGVRVSGANFSMDHCTVADNGVGLILEAGAADASVGNSLFANNNEAAVRMSGRASETFRGRKNGYYGPGLDAGRISAEPGSLAADPLFLADAEARYALGWDSPMRYLGEYGRPAGARPAQARPVPAPAARVAGLDADSAIVRWETPGFDTTGQVRFRPAGAGEWQIAVDPVQGSVHGVGLMGLRPGTEYEFQIEVSCRRGPEASSEVMAFTTPAQPREPAIFHVLPDGDDDVDGLTPETAWRTIRHACLTAGPGDTVLVAPGEYPHPIAPARGGTADRRLTFRGLVGENGARATIAGGGVLNPLVEIDHRDYVTVDGFDLDMGRVFWVGAPTLINIERSRGVEILNCRRAGEPSGERGGTAGASLMARGARGLRVEGNLFYKARYHLRLFSCHDAVVKNNTLALKSVVNVQLGSCRNLTFVNNLLYENRSFRNAFVSFHARNWDEARLDHNLYFTTDPSLKIARGTVAGEDFEADDLAAWQALSGQGQNSLSADPLFAGDADTAKIEASSLLLRLGSPALGAGEGGADIGAAGVAEP